MKSNSIVVGVVLLGAVALSTYSQTAAPKPALTVKIAVVALRDAMLATQEGRKAAQQMQGKYGPQRAALEKLQNEIAGGEDQLRKGGATMSAEAQNRVAGELAAKKKRLQRDGDDLEAEMEQEENRLVQRSPAKWAR